MTVGGGKIKQDLTIADNTATATLTIWQDLVGQIELEQSYQFNRIIVRTFKGKCNLSFPHTGASFEKNQSHWRDH